MPLAVPSTSSPPHPFHHKNPTALISKTDFPWEVSDKHMPKVRFDMFEIDGKINWWVPTKKVTVTGQIQTMKVWVFTPTAIIPVRIGAIFKYKLGVNGSNLGPIVFILLTTQISLRKPKLYTVQQVGGKNLTIQPF